MFLDTSGLLILFDARDARHSEAARVVQEASRRVTHSYLIAELVALLDARRLNRAASLAFVADLTDNPHIEFHWVGESRHREAFALLQSHRDKTYSLCDAVRFVLMRERGLTNALTTDHHFEQAGFVRLLKQ